MAQWSRWDLVSSRLGPDQRNFWKAVAMGKGVSEQGTSARAHHVTAACGWMGCSPRRVLPEGMLQDTNCRECRRVRVQMDHCSHGAQMHAATAKASFSSGFFLCSKAAEMKCWSQKTDLWKHILVEKLPPASIGKTPSDSRQGVPACHILWIAETEPRPAEISHQKADHSSLLLQATVNNAISTTLEEN